ncbi:WD40-repeat-containing domain protein [Suillus lakei]|nr:WD40-repeat-containing domain protein [Suillus lakei]
MSLVEIPRAPTMSSPAAKTKKTSAATSHKTMRGHTSLVRGVAQLPGRQHMVTCSNDGSLRLWDLESGGQIGEDWRDEGNKSGIITMALSPNGKTIASGSSDGTVRLRDVETGKVVVKWKEHTDTVTSVCWSPDGEQVVSGGWDGTIRVWDVKSGEPVLGLNPIKTGHENLWAVSYSPKATMIATGGDGGIKIWDAKTPKLLSTIGDAQVCSLTWTSDENKLIAGTGLDLIRIFDTATWQQIAILDGHERLVYSITLFPNDRLLASTSWDHTARLWNLDTNLPVGPPLRHKNWVVDAAFSADGKLLSTACHDNNAYVWDIQTILKAAGSEDLLTMPDAPSSMTESSQNIEYRSFLEADATRGFDQLGDADELPPGFFGGTRANVHTSATPGARPKSFALLGRFPPLLRRSRPSETLETQHPAVSRSHALLNHLSSLLHRSRPNEVIEIQQSPVPSGSRSRALLNRLSSLLHSSQNADEISEHPQPPMLSRLRPQVLLGHLSSLLPRSRLHTDEVNELQQSQTPSGSRPGALIGLLSSLFRSPPNANEGIELQQWPRQITSSHCSPQVVEVPAMRDREVIFVARRPETASEQARRIKNPKPWAYYATSGFQAHSQNLVIEDIEFHSEDVTNKSIPAKQSPPIQYPSTRPIEASILNPTFVSPIFGAVCKRERENHISSKEDESHTPSTSSPSLCRGIISNPPPRGILVLLLISLVCVIVASVSKLVDLLSRGVVY